MTNTDSGALEQNLAGMQASPQDRGEESLLRDFTAVTKLRLTDGQKATVLRILNLVDDAHVSTINITGGRRFGKTTIAEAVQLATSERRRRGLVSADTSLPVRRVRILDDWMPGDVIIKCHISRGRIDDCHNDDASPLKVDEE